MTYRGRVKDGQILLDEPVRLPEGTAVNVDVTPQGVRITRGKTKPQKFAPIRMPGPSLADELVRDRR